MGAKFEIALEGPEILHFVYSTYSQMNNVKAIFLVLKSLSRGLSLIFRILMKINVKWLKPGKMMLIPN